MRFGYWMPSSAGGSATSQMSNSTLALPPGAGGRERAARLRPEPDRGAEPQRHQGPPGPVDRRLDPRSGDRGCDRAARAHAGGPPNYHSPSLTAKALSTLRSSPRPVEPQRRQLVVEGRGDPVGAPFDVHDARYSRTEEGIDSSAAAHRGTVTHHGELYDLEGWVSSRSRRRCRRSTWAANTEGEGGHQPLGTASVMHGDAPT